MCGIAMVLCEDGDGREQCVQQCRPLLHTFFPFLAARGPDCQSSRLYKLGGAHGYVLGLAASLLQLRGDHAVSVPHIDAHGNVLCYNGEIYNGISMESHINDGTALLAALGACTHDNQVVGLLSRLQGPFSLLYWQPQNNRVWVARDRIGRRSLVLWLPIGQLQPLVFASLTLPELTPSQWVEVPPGIYHLQLQGMQNTSALQGCTESNNQPTANDFGNLDTLQHLQTADSTAARHGLSQPDVERQLEAAPLSALQQHFVSMVQSAAPYVTFCSLPWAEDATGVAGQPWWEYVRPSNMVDPTVNQDDSILAESAACRTFRALQEAVAVRCGTIAQASEQSNGTCDSSNASRTAVPLLPAASILLLFSGGVDSTLLAALAHQHIDPGQPIDLINICFDNGTSPDRLAALDALEELQAISAGRTWRLLGINASLADVDRHRQHLLHLLSPAGTVMDFNIGAALWLAARGEGRLLQCTGANVEPRAGVVYRSMARVVFLGHGADELCGGYGRHRTCFREGSWLKLQRELTLDMRRLWLRNLGRDDRLVADHGREARHPFLDERLIAHVLSLPLWDIVDLREPPGTGDKQVLRQALQLLALPRAAQRVKRAIQFGSRLGKLTNIRDFGSNRAANTRNAGSLSVQRQQGEH